MPRHAVAHVALYKASTAFDSARPALQAPHAVANIALNVALYEASTFAICYASTALDGARPDRTLRAPHAAADVALCDESTALDGARRALRAPHAAANVAI